MLNEDIARNYQLRTLRQVKKTDLPVTSKNIFDHDYTSCDLECRAYRCGYEHNQEIFDMELSFPEPISFIIGENGIGKSTFVRCLCGLNKKFKGTTWLNQEKIRDFSKKVALVMQDVNYQLFSDSVWEELSLVNEDEADKTVILKEFELYGKKEAHPQSLSGGEKQRLAIAICQASHKPIMIFDEPTSGLCKKSMQQTIHFIHQIANEQRKIIIITHDYEFIQACGGQVLEFVK